jgi:hypothetical protein
VLYSISKTPDFKILAAVLMLIISSAVLFAQSSDVMFPTPLRQPVLDGVIRSRPIGDSRLTTYYFTFQGDQGDLFINVKTENFTGDIDLYYAAGLKPLTKIVIYADASERETGRVVYLRKPERLILRIEGRAQGDEDARFQIKFAGGFIASAEADVPEEPRVPRAVLNAVNTRLQDALKEPREKTNDKQAQSVPLPDEPLKRTDGTLSTTDEPPKGVENNTAVEKQQTTPKVIVSDPLAKSSADSNSSGDAPVLDQTQAAVSADNSASNAPEKDSGSKEIRPKTGARQNNSKRKAEKPPETNQADPLQNVRLIIKFRDGSVIERPLVQVLRFSVERGILTVILRNGTIGRYSMLDVANVTIE